MSDYLNNIVSRSLSVADVVQPRVPHLFEQSAAAIAVEAEPFDAGESAAETMIDSNETPLSTTMSQISSEVTTPFLEQFRPTLAVQAAGPLSVLLEPPMPAQEISKGTTDPAAINESAISVSSVPLQTPESQQRRTASPNAARVADSVVPSRVGPTQVEPSATIRKGEPASDKTNASISPGMPATLPQISRAEQQLPPIRISIGRVDVRAVMPAGPAKAAVPTRPKPALSLESYLKQREEGKR